MGIIANQMLIDLIQALRQKHKWKKQAKQNGKNINGGDKEHSSLESADFSNRGDN